MRHRSGATAWWSCWAAGGMGEVWRAGYVDDEIDALGCRQQDDGRLRVFADIPLGTLEVADKIKKLTPGRCRAALDVLMTIAIKPVGKGGYKVVDPHTGRKAIKEERAEVSWK